MQDQKISNTDVVARNGDGVWPTPAFNVSNMFAHPITNPSGTVVAIFLLDDNLLTLPFVVRMERVEDAIGGLFQAVSEGVIASVVVVVTHTVSSFLVDHKVFLLNNKVLSSGTGALVFDVVGRLDAATIIAFGVIEIGITTIYLDVDLGIGVTTLWFVMADARSANRLMNGQGHD